MLDSSYHSLLDSTKTSFESEPPFVACNTILFFTQYQYFYQKCGHSAVNYATTPAGACYDLAVCYGLVSALNGLMIRNWFWTMSPSCISSEYTMVAPAVDALATTRLSQKQN
jgi:hypothetical protein